MAWNKRELIFEPGIFWLYIFNHQYDRGQHLVPDLDNTILRGDSGMADTAGESQ